MAIMRGTIDAMALDIKRFYAAGVVVVDTCPSCGKECVNDLGEVPLSFPVVNQATSLGMYCRDGCGHEWSIPIVIQMALEIAEGGR